MKSKNHLYPAFHIRKWRDCGGRIYNKSTKTSRKVKDHEDYTSRFYYSLGEENSELEDRLLKFESKIAPIIKRIDEADEKVVLTGQELELLKLYCVLCGSRHEFTSEVILSDESGIYQSNNYIFGLHRVKTQEEAVKMTEFIMDDFDKIVAMDKNIESWIDYRMLLPEYSYSVMTCGLHIAIARSDEPILCISDRYCIIENTLDSDFLYAYVPISPRTALFLVKSKYYFDKSTFEYTKYRFGQKYGNGIPDPYLSVILGSYIKYDVEDKLFCSYNKVRSCVHVDDVYYDVQKVRSATIAINTLPKMIFRQYNSIFCEDGQKILYCDENELQHGLKYPLGCRNVTIG